MASVVQIHTGSAPGTRTRILAAVARAPRPLWRPGRASFRRLVNAVALDATLELRDGDGIASGLEEISLVGRSAVTDVKTAEGCRSLDQGASASPGVSIHAVRPSRASRRKQWEERVRRLPGSCLAHAEAEMQMQMPSGRSDLVETCRRPGGRPPPIPSHLPSQLCCVLSHGKERLRRAGKCNSSPD
ncbi:hypothetical protein ACCO45_002939 [Purpureocillium lilacinum]|uniref:Uncharacterized protein n=1 Tax=Purpureocillium lilacinum TaxID=33203 RepID=A0ACC4DYS6_PURLI